MIRANQAFAKTERCNAKMAPSAAYNPPNQPQKNATASTTTATARQTTAIYAPSKRSATKAPASRNAAAGNLSAIPMKSARRKAFASKPPAPISPAQTAKHAKPASAKAPAKALCARTDRSVVSAPAWILAEPSPAIKTRFASMAPAPITAPAQDAQPDKHASPMADVWWMRASEKPAILASFAISTGLAKTHAPAPFARPDKCVHKAHASISRPQAAAEAAKAARWEHLSALAASRQAAAALWVEWVEWEWAVQAETKQPAAGAQAIAALAVARS